jgi:hypothetical protein
MITLKKVWAFLKTYWYVPVLIIVAIILGSKKDKISDILNIANDSHKKQLDAINAAEKEKVESKKKIEEEYENAIKEIETNYEDEKNKLSIKDKKYIKKIVKDWTDDPDQMAERIRVRFGFDYVPKTNNSNTD